MDTRYLVGTLGQWLSFLTVSGGIAVELVRHVDAGYFLISAGAVLFAVATALKRRTRRALTPRGD